MKRRLLLAIAVVFSVTSYAQNDIKFEFEDRSYEMKETQVPEFVKAHALGTDVQRGMYLLDQQYTYKVEPTATDPNPAPQVEKAAIYKGIKKLDNYYRKQVKKGLITEDQAKKEFGQIVNIGFSIRYQNTIALEEVLWKKRKPEELSFVFLNQITLY